MTTGAKRILPPTGAYADGLVWLSNTNNMIRAHIINHSSHLRSLNSDELSEISAFFAQLAEAKRDHEMPAPSSVSVEYWYGGAKHKEPPPRRPVPLPTVKPQPTVKLDDCLDCMGTGTYAHFKCPTCAGTGKEMRALAARNGR